METLNPNSPEYKKAAGNYRAFRRASNILDLALASAQCAEALKIDVDDKNQAIVIANNFYQDVRKNIVPNDNYGAIEQIIMGHANIDWKSKHSAYLRQAEEVYDALGDESQLTGNTNFKENFDRLKQKISDGKEIELIVD